MKIYIGIDGGGTKTHLIAAGENGKMLKELISGSSNFLIEGVEPVAEKIYNLILEALSHMNLKPSDIQSIVIGSKGAGRKSDADKLYSALIKFALSKNVKLNNLHITSDAEAALEGAFAGEPGCILISGTGSIMYGKDSAGNIHRVGGYGKYIGDEGSGYSIGRKGLQLFSKIIDGRVSSPVFYNLFLSRYKISSGDQLITQMYSNNLDVASIAPTVLEAGEGADPNCLEIIGSEIDELLLHIIAMQAKLKVKEMNLCLVGSLIENENIFSINLREQIEIKLPDVEIQVPKYQPAYGAILLSKKLF